MLEPYEGKLSRTVLRGEGGSNTADLPDQLIENKQKFIGQIMTSKSPVRSCEDIDGVLPVNRTIKNNKFLYRQPNYGWRYFYATFIY